MSSAVEALPAIPLFAEANIPETVRGDMRYRPLGRTGAEVSILGLGGFHIGMQKDEQESIRIIRSAIDAGVNFMDNSWDYNDGASEERMGRALQDGYRERVFLMTKIDGRSKKSAAVQIDESLRRLRTDRIDLVQHHEIIRLEDPDRIFRAGGAQEAMLEARQAGKLRFIGFTGHKDPLVHRRMLEVAGEHGFYFDTVQMPLNVLDAHFRSFARHVLPELIRQGIGVLGMKSLGNGQILKSGCATPVECLHYAMSLPTST
ncbi:MAG TPA: aldo/keto reductase, partial [Planctomycetaceae bacterium]|nr:aldo/keto reductase [Planctomycetaceae bacterium]